MKKATNVTLTLCAAVLLYLCYASIMQPIKFNEERTVREAAVKARLLQIKNAEEQYRMQHHGEFCDSFHVLINFIKTARIPNVTKIGELTEEQMTKGLTEAKAAEIVNSGDAKAIAENKLEGFRRDTTWTPMAETILGENGNADSIEYVPYGEGEKFELEKTIHVGRSGVTQNVMECRASYYSYLKGMNEREIYNLTDAAEKSGRYPGLKIGDLLTPNNNAGNWE
ncbi:MAG: hypothetical protein IJZ01_05000 [Paraprevotella sp.]|nr:hypothetical protein [Paraprevotella sp.]MBQ8282907.1 hypothetical protein [Paraprevotella sp.]